MGCFPPKKRGIKSLINSLEKLLRVVEVHVLSDCVLHQRSWEREQRQSFNSCHTIKRDIINLHAAGLTPTVRHDLQGQRQQVIERGIQHHWLDLGVWHHSPAGWKTKQSHRGIQVNGKCCGLTLDECVVHSLSSYLPSRRGGWEAVCHWKTCRSGRLDWLVTLVYSGKTLNSVWHQCGLELPVKPPIDQAYTMMSLSWKPSLCIANWITTSMALASFWGNGSPWWNKQVRQDANVIQVPLNSLNWSPLCLYLIMSSTERQKNTLYFILPLLYFISPLNCIAAQLFLSLPKLRCAFIVG